MRGDRYPSEDGPGASGKRIEISVRVMVGTQRSTIIVSTTGSPSTRIVAAPGKLAAAAGQRVSELVAEALAASSTGDAGDLD